MRLVVLGSLAMATGHCLSGDQLSITAELIQSGLTEPTLVAAIPGDVGRLFVVEKRGRVRLIKNGVLQQGSFLNIDSLVPDETWNGMLGLCFDPDFDSNGYFYVQHTRGTSSSNRVCVARYTVSAGDPDAADTTSRHVILDLTHPGSNAFHVGGWIGFGPDRMLYIPMGDGGYSGDSTAGARSQSLTSLWGKVLRVDPHGADAYPSDANRNFGIPPDNPFIGQGIGEIWARGLRNPYRADFDDATGDFWIADVGLYMREEVNVIESAEGGGQNFGWDCAEGTWCVPNAQCSCGSDLTEPHLEYQHNEGCSITGGSVYDGCEIDGMQGRYFYGDWCGGDVWSCRLVDGVVVDVQDHTAALNPGGQPDISGITAIGADWQGELIVVSQQGNLFRIVPEGGALGCEVAGDANGDGIVGVDDVLVVLQAWGACMPGPVCMGDLNGDWIVGVDDMLILLANWTP